MMLRKKVSRTFHPNYKGIRLHRVEDRRSLSPIRSTRKTPFKRPPVVLPSIKHTPPTTHTQKKPSSPTRTPTFTSVRGKSEKSDGKDEHEGTQKESSGREAITEEPKVVREMLMRRESSLMRLPFVVRRCQRVFASRRKSTFSTDGTVRDPSTGEIRHLNNLQSAKMFKQYLIEKESPVPVFLDGVEAYAHRRSVVAGTATNIPPQLHSKESDA